MTRQNIKSLWDQPWRDDDDVMALFLPYSGNRADPVLVEKHEALGRLPKGTLGRGYWEIYKKNGYAFPGDPNAVNVAFARPHDSTHVISGYDTSPHGEILVSTFTAGMHPNLPMEGHILPVIFSWHLGIEINKLAGSFTRAFDPEQFWVAWVRGAQMTVDLFSPHLARKSLSTSLDSVIIPDNRDHGHEFYASAVASLDGCSVVNHAKAASKSRKALS
jgi:hypothetical protein